VLAVGIADALLLLVLLYVAFVDRSDAAVSVLGPVHGIGYVILLYLTVSGAGAKRWGWWFPAIVLVTGGPARLDRRRLRPATPAPRELTVAREVAIRGDTIRLGQLLKLAGVVGAGGELKALLAEVPVLVNGEPDARRGRQLHPGDVIVVGDEELRVVAG
jgi:ribosome-associated protein